MWGFDPVSFWHTHPAMFWWTAEALVDKAKPKKAYAGGLTQSEVEAISKRQEEIDNAKR